MLKTLHSSCTNIMQKRILYNNYSETRNLIGQQPCRITQSCTGNSCTEFYKYTRIVKFHCTIPFDFEVSLQLLRRWFSYMNKFQIDTLLFSK
jgi:hypothetical protein